MVRSVLAVLGLVSLIAVSAVSVQAYNDYGRDDEVVQLRVPTTGLDLTTRDGVALLDDRINRAVRKLCDYDGGSSVLNTYRLERRCRANAYASTHRQVASAIDEAWRNRRYAMAQRGYGPHRQYRQPVKVAQVQRFDGPVYGGAPQGRPDVPPYYRDDSPRDAIDADLAGQPSGVRGAVEQAMVQAFARGDIASWRSWNARGYVTVSDPREQDGAECRNVVVYHAVLGGYETIARGLRCRTLGYGYDADR